MNVIKVDELNQELYVQEEIPVLDSCDVLVVGGGLAGVSAAASAAQRGCRTILIEKNTFLGGLGDGTIADWESSVLNEFWEDSRRGIRERTAQEMLDYLIKKSVVLYLHTMAVDVHVSKQKIKGIVVATKTGIMEVRSRVVIDTTGGCLICHKAGSEGNYLQGQARASFGIGGINYEVAAVELRKNGNLCSFIQKEKNGELIFTIPESICKEWMEIPIPEKKICISYYGDSKISEVYGLERTVDLLNEEEIGNIYINMNFDCYRLAELLRNKVPGFGNAFLDWTSPCIGLNGGFFPICEMDGEIRTVKGIKNLLTLQFSEGGNDYNLGKTPSEKWENGKTAGISASKLGISMSAPGKRKWIHSVKIPILKKCDVLVVGGGASGIVAAIAAARKGMKTILVERNPLVGGDMLAGGLSWLSYYNLFREFQVEERQLVFGIGYEIVRRLVEMGGSPGFYIDYAPYTQESKGTHGDRECIKTLFLKMLHEEHVDILLNTLFLDALVEEKNYIDGNEIKGAIVQNRTNRFAIQAGVVIDASGDGDVAFQSGANCKEYESHGVGMAFGVTHVNFEKALNFARQKNAVAHEAYGQTGEMQGKIVKYSLRTYFIPELYEKVKESGIHNSFCIESSHGGEGTYINGVTVPNSNIIEPGAATRTIIDLRRRLFKSADFLKENIPGFEETELNWCTQIPGARQTRCVDCRCSISAEDVTNGNIPEDTIGLFGGQDGHYAGYKIKNGGWYGIPYRALIPNFIRNLLVVGRMLSADWVAYMSTRLNVSCFIQGQAAGTAAAMAIRNDCIVSDIDIEALRDELRNDGVYLG